MKLKQIANISAGYPFRGKIPEASDSLIHVIQMKDILLSTGIAWDKSIKTTLPGKGKPDWLQPDDILFAARGNHHYAVLVDQRANHLCAIAAPHFYLIRCVSQQILPSYLNWLLNQGTCQRYYQKEAEGTFTKSIRRSVLEATPIAIPPLAQQYQIVHLAQTLQQEQQLMQQLIENNQRLMDMLASNLLIHSN